MSLQHNWTVSVEATTDRPLADDGDELIRRFSDYVQDYAGAVAGGSGHRGYSATFSIRDEDGVAGAATIAEEGFVTFLRLAGKAGLPAADIVNLQVLTDEQLDIENARRQIPELVGVAEIAEILGVSRQRVSELAHQPDFPRPIAELRSGPVWTLPSLTQFQQTWHRRPGRPPKLFRDLQGVRLDVRVKIGGDASKPATKQPPARKGGRRNAASTE